MKDIINSLNRALIDQEWVYGDKLQRIGNPFMWVDGDRTPALYIVEGVQAFLQYLTMFYEEYPMPEDIVTSDYDEMRQHIESSLRQAFNHFVPFLDVKESGFEKNILSTTTTRVQDYCAIRHLCKGLSKQLNHLDIGPGLGSHAIYSLKGFDACFYGLEASPHSYSIQRDFFRFLAKDNSIDYLDLVECENFNLDRSKISSFVNSSSDYKIKHIPTWHFDMIEKASIDLITATWVLNEVNTSGILWLLSHASKVLRKEGYFYMRDSSKLKPLRHSIDYDELLTKMGFVESGRLNVQNRINFHGLPRAYQKMTDTVYSFDELVETCLGKFAITAHEGDYIQNVPPSSEKKS